jgi:hypothetical protein
MTQQLADASTPVSTQPAAGRSRRLSLIAAGALAAVAGNLLISVIARAAGASSGFTPLHPATLIPLTVVGFIAGASGWSVIRARANRPARVLRIAVPTVVVLSFGPDIAVLVSGQMTGVSAGAVLALMCMHLMVAAVAIPAYARALPLHDREPATR